MKYKVLTKEQILLSLDRLTRFKNTKEKYLRVFSDILMSNLIEPKFKKADILKLDYKELTYYVSEIFNNSIDNRKFDNNINLYLKNYENSIFNNDKDTQILLDNNINYLGVLNLIEKEAPVNLLWLKEVIKNINNNFDILIKHRKEKLLKFPIEKIILVEGITEEILLPAFSKVLGHDFYAKGIQIIPAGGKNQVVKMYYKLSAELKIPIFILLDKDAEANIKQIQPRLRNIDKIHLVSCGEFEDLLEKSLIIKTINSHFKNFLLVTEKDITSELPMAKVLEEIFKTKGLHEFKKAEFAKLIKENIKSEEDVSSEIRVIIREINITNKMLDSKICS